MNDDKILRIDEETIIVYIQHLRDNGSKPSTMFKIWSAIKSCLNVFDGIDCSEFKLITKCLLNNSNGFHSKQAAIFTKKEIMDFIYEQNRAILKHQVAASLMYFGGLRRAEAAHLEHKDIKILESEGMCFCFISVCIYFIFFFCYGYL